MPAVAAFTPAQNDRIRKVMAAMVARLGSQAKVGEAVGLTQVGVGAFLDGKYGTSNRVAERLAKLAGMTLDQLVSGDEIPTAARADEYPNRQLVLEFARQVGCPTSVQRQIRATSPRGRSDVPALEWLRLLGALLQVDALPFADEPESEKPKRTRQK